MKQELRKTGAKTKRTEVIGDHRRWVCGVDEETILGGKHRERVLFYLHDNRRLSGDSVGRIADTRRP